MEVKPGYKQTEVGVIPEEWNVKTIDQVAFVTSGKRLPLGSSLVDVPTPHPYIRVTDMRPGTVDTPEIRYVPESVFPAIKRYRIFRADIFISVAGSLGIVGKIPAELDGANLTENADRITDITCSQDYLLYVLLSPLIQNAIDSIRTVGAQPKLALTRIRKFAIPLPPTEAEQRAIAVALSDVDTLLDGLDRLIAKKRDLKQAAMQQLLTGQTRLPGFSGEWEMKRLGDVLTICHGKSQRETNQGSFKGGTCKTLRVEKFFAACSRAVERLQRQYPNLVLVHGPVHASWLNQIEIYFSIVQRKVLTPNDFDSLADVETRVLAFQRHYQSLARPFEWTFTRRDLARLLAKLALQKPDSIAA